MLKGAGGSVYAGVGIKEIWEGTARVAVSFLRISFREIIFYEKDKVVEEIEGWPGENRWRYDEIRKII